MARRAGLDRTPLDPRVDSPSMDLGELTVATFQPLVGGTFMVHAAGAQTAGWSGERQRERVVATRERPRLCCARQVRDPGQAQGDGRARHADGLERRTDPAAVGRTPQMRGAACR